MNVNQYSTGTLQAVVDVLDPCDQMKMDILEGLRSLTEILTEHYTEKLSSYDSIELQRLNAVLHKQCLQPQYIQSVHALQKYGKNEHPLAEYFSDLNLTGDTPPCALGLFPIIGMLDQKIDNYVCTTLDSSVNHFELDIQVFMEEHPFLMLLLASLLQDLIKDILKQGVQKVRHTLSKKKQKKLCKQQQATQLQVDTKTHILCDKTGKIYTAVSLNNVGRDTVH